MRNYSKKLVNLCIKNGIKISLAESCTGGLISSKLIGVENVSKILDYGIVTYSNNSKIHFLKVPKHILEKHGAVSRETAEAMVYGLSDLSETNFSMAVTGIAGPGGESKDKPIGLVYHSFFSKNSKNLIVIKKNYTGNRNQIRNYASLYSIYKSYIILKSTV